MTFAPAGAMTPSAEFLLVVVNNTVSVIVGPVFHVHLSTVRSFTSISDDYRIFSSISD